MAIWAEVQITGITRDTEHVTLHWQGGYGPYLIETSNDLLHWSDQGEPAVELTRNVPAFGDRSFHRISDLNASNLYGDFFGFIETDQGEFGALLARHRLKTRCWFYKTKGAPHASAVYTPADYWRKLLLNYQYHEDGRVRTWTGPLETLGTIATPASQRMTVTWTRGVGPTLRTFLLTLDFPYDVHGNRTAPPLPSDPGYELKCTYATAREELDLFGMAMVESIEDKVILYQLDTEPTPWWPEKNYRVTKNGAQVQLHFIEGLPLLQGSPPFIWKTMILKTWLSPSTGSGGSLPEFSTDSYFTRTLLPGHHNFFEIVLLEPALDPAISEATRSALAAANIRYVYTFKDIDLGMSPDDIRFIGYDHTIREP
jgi:hypothetical protein